MTDDDTTGLDLPRRKLLGALGAVGASSAGAGLGTSAYLNDTESFTGNSLTAGTLNIELQGLTVAKNSDAMQVEGGVGTTFESTTSTAFFTFGDVKPGDLAILCLEIVVEGNPVHLKLNGSILDNEGDFTEPEQQTTSDTGGGEGDGELAEHTKIQAFGPTTQSLSANGATASGLESELQNEYSSFSASTDSSSPNLTGGSPVFVNQAFATQTGGTDYLLTDSSDDCFDPDATYRIYFVMSVDETVGNIIQADSFDLDLTVDAVQCRHNDDTPFEDDG